MTQRDWRAAAVLFVIVSTVYFATVAGITSSNDGSHYALVRALADKRSFEISEFLSFTENQDYSLRGDLRFSDRPPGTAILAAPIYALSAVLPQPVAMIHSKHDPDNPRVIYAALLPVIAASVTVLLLFWLLRAHFDLPLWPAAITTLALAFGTVTWKYGSLLYSHATSGLMVMIAVALILRWERTPPTPRAYFWLGLALGGSVLMEYTNVVFAAAAGAYLLWTLASPPGPLSRWASFDYAADSAAAPLRMPVSGEGEKWKRLAWVVFGSLLPAAFLMWYNAVNFGSPLALSTFNADTTRWPQNQSLLTDFATPIWVGLPAMLFYGSDNQGLFWLAPISLLGLIGLREFWNHSRRQFILIIGAFTAMLLLFSASTTFNPYTNDGRYITPFLGLWFVAVGFGASRMQGLPLREAIIYGLLFLSVRNQIMHIAFSWGHDFDLAALRPLSAAPENIIALWRAVLPNAINVPLWWGVLAVGWLAWRLGRKKTTDRANVADRSVKFG